MTEISLRETDSWADVLPAVGDLANKVSGTSFVPDSFKGKPAEIAACILTGREVGIGPMEALQKIHSIKGKPTMSAELMRSLALRAGHEITFTVLTADKVTAKGRRAGSQQWTEVTWTIQDAERIGVTSKDTWKKHPRQMLEARASSELCRLLFPDALGGVSYTPDEIEDDTASSTPRTAKRANTARTSEGVSMSQDDTKAPPRALQAVQDGTGVTQVADDAEVIDAEVIEDNSTDDGNGFLVSAVMDGKGITGVQVKMMGGLMSQLAMGRDAALDFCKDITGRDLTSSQDLTKDEAQKIIDTLVALLDIAGGESDDA
jgi:hypothetical protein